MSITDWILLLTMIIVIWYSWETRELRKSAEESLHFDKRSNKLDKTINLMLQWSTTEYVQSQNEIQNQKDSTELYDSADQVLQFIEILGSLYKLDLIDRKLILEHFQIQVPDILSKLSAVIEKQTTESPKSWENALYLNGEVAKYLKSGGKNVPEH